MNFPDRPSLRERKQAAVKDAVKRVAVDLALKHGYDHVTVEMICEASMISARTFYNYFGSKEGVILATPMMVSEAERDTFVHQRGPDVLTDLVGLVASAVTVHEPDPDFYQARLAVIGQSPYLSARRTVLIGELQDQYVEVVLQRFLAQGRDSAANTTLEDEARMVVIMVYGVMSFAARKWFSPGFSGSPSELFGNSIALLRHIALNNADSAK